MMSCIAGAATIGHHLEARGGLVLEIKLADMRGAAGADGRGRRLAGIGLEPGDQLRPGPCRQRVLADDDERRRGQQRHGRQILEDVPGDRIHRACADMARPVADAQRVAVGCRFDGAGDADACARAGDVLDHDRLAERLAHALAQDAGERVGRAARRERHDHRNGARRILLGECVAGERTEHGRDDGRSSEPSHGHPPWNVADDGDPCKL
jgi:hypothetical protein